MAINRFRDIETLALNNDFIYSDQFLVHAHSCPYCEYSKRDFLYKGGIWRNESVGSSIFRSRQPKAANLLIGHSDIKTSIKNVWPFLIKGYRRVWAANSVPTSGILSSLPLGLTNPTLETKWHQILGKTSHLKSADEDCSFLENFDASIFANFSVHTNSKARKPLAQFLVSRGVGFSEPEFTVSGRIGYLKQLRQYSLTVCPEGNGVDTHRLWETLYMGGTPVITHSNLLTELVEDLPVIVLRNWGELQNLDLLESKWHALQTKRFRFEKLTASYWLGQICSR